MNVVLSILVVAGLLFGGGATVSAAQDDLPNEPLYAIKTWTEDLSLQFRHTPEEKVMRLMDLAQVRIQEMTRLSEAGEPVPDQVKLRLEQHIQQALQLCTNMDDPTLERALLQIRDRLQEQDRDMEQLQLHTQDQLQTQEQLQLQTQTRTMLHERLQLVEDGLLNHEMFRNAAQNGFQYGQDEDVTSPVQNQNQDQNQNQNQNEQQNGEPNPDPGSNSNDSGGGDNGNGSGGSNTNDNGSGGGGKP